MVTSLRIGETWNYSMDDVCGKTWDGGRGGGKKSSFIELLHDLPALPAFLVHKRGFIEGKRKEHGPSQDSTAGRVSYTSSAIALRGFLVHCEL